MLAYSILVDSLGATLSGRFPQGAVLFTLNPSKVTRPVFADTTHSHESYQQTRSSHAYCVSLSNLKPVFQAILTRFWSCIVVRMSHLLAVVCGIALFSTAVQADPGPAALNETLRKENAALGIKAKAISQIDDLAYLRRVSIDLIGRIPTHGEIVQYNAWAPAERRTKILDKLMDDPRFVDRWTTFFADMLRLRANSPGGGAALAFVHKAIEQEMPYDEIARRFISANGKANAVPEVAFVLGDNADPMALAGVTAQVFMGVRIACAQCHDHPFDKWTREDFYGFAAYFGKTRRYENDFTNTVYTQEVSQTSVLWPPEGEGDASDRKPMPPKFLISLVNASATTDYLARLNSKRQAAQKAIDDAKNKTADVVNLDLLLADAGDKALDRAKGKRPSEFDIVGEAKREREQIDLTAQYKSSELRTRLAHMVANPRNRYFSESFVNRVWKDLIGRGIVEPIDDFSDTNAPSHPKLLALLADEFVASGFQLKPLVRTIVSSEAYQRGQALGLDDLARSELENAFLAVPARRMLSEVLYDSIVAAGDLFEYKHPQGTNMKTVSNRVRVPVKPDGEEIVQTLALNATGAAMKPGMKKAMAKNDLGYNLEQGIEIDFDSVLKKAKEAQNEAVVVEKMVVKSQEELEAERMQMERPGGRRMRYVYKMVSRTFDDNPMFGSSFRMASPSAPEHFIRVFGQTDRSQLGEKREHTPSMRQALMMLNGRMTHEASRVGPFEPMHKLLVGKKANLDKAVELAYLQILTRTPQNAEVEAAKEIVKDAQDDLEGMADLRWVLLNSNEFRYLP
jgi:hypothetical protein